MTMAMGMEHTGLAGREMAKLMEEDIRQKFFFALFLSIPIIAYSPLGEKILGLSLPQPIPAAWILLYSQRLFFSIPAGYFYIPLLKLFSKKL